MIFTIAVFSLLASAFGLPLNQTITVKQSNYIETPNITDWGTWGSWEKCPFGRHAQAIQVKTEPYQGVLYDDSALNGIRLYCGDPTDSSTQQLTSRVGDFGGWGNLYSCRNDNLPLPPNGYIVGLQFRIEASHSGDDTATNNLRIICSYPGGGLESKTEADGLDFGEWGDEKRCGFNQVVCGLQTQVESSQGSGDDTALNNIRAECCTR